MKIYQLVEKAQFEDRKDNSFNNIKKTNLDLKPIIDINKEPILLEKENKLPFKIMKKIKLKAEQNPDHKDDYKTKIKENYNELLKIEKLPNLVSSLNIELKPKEEIILKLENQLSLQLGEKYGLKDKEKEKLIKEDKPKLNKKDKDIQEIEEKIATETEQKKELARTKKSKFEVEEKPHLPNIRNVFNLNQIESSFINTKGSTKSKEKKSMAKNSDNITNKKDLIKIEKEAPFSFLFSLLFLLYPFSFSICEEKKKIKTKITHIIKIGKISGKDKNIKKEIVNIKINKKKKRNLYVLRNIMEYFLIIASFIQIVLPNYELDFIQSQFSKIILKINGIGTKYVITSNPNFISSYYPNIIYINGEKQSTIKISYYFNQTENDVILIWNNTINYCKNMFNDCTNITEIDLSGFNSSDVINMAAMFRGCSKLTSINLTNLDTSKVTEMGSMFRDCSELSSLDLSSFDTSKVTSMGAMFHQCSKLTSLNLSNFNTTNVKNMDSMFSGCSSLEYINLKNFIENELLTIDKIFEQVPENVVVCLNDNSNSILSAINNKACHTTDCSENWEIEQKKIVNKKSLCVDNSGIDITFKYEYKGKYYVNCLNGNLISNTDIQSCQCDTENCLTCPNEPLVEDLCLECNNNYYPIENDNYTHIEGYVKCHKDPIGYYLDKNESIYKKCYYTCKECEKMGNNITHNCLICDDNYSYNISKNNYSNCYENSSYYNDENNYDYIINSTVLDESPQIIMSSNLEDYPQIIMTSNLEEYPQIIMTSNEVITEGLTEGLTEKVTKLKNNDLKNLIESIKKNETEEMLKEKENEYYNTILTTLEKSFTSENYDTTDLDNGIDEIIETEKMKITLTTTENQRNNINENLTYVNLGECEELLREFYNLTNNSALYMIKLEISQEGMKIPKIEYYVYSKLNGKNLIKLNLSECQNTKISLSIPVMLY